MSKNEADLRKVLVHLNEYVADEDMPTIRDLITAYAERQSLLAVRDEMKKAQSSSDAGWYGTIRIGEITRQLNILEKGEE